MNHSTNAPDAASERIVRLNLKITGDDGQGVTLESTDQVVAALLPMIETTITTPHGHFYVEYVGRDDDNVVVLT